MRIYIVIDQNNKEIFRDKNIFRVRDLINFRQKQGKIDSVLSRLSLPDGYTYTEKISMSEFLG